MNFLFPQRLPMFEAPNGIRARDGLAQEAGIPFSQSVTKNRLTDFLQPRSLGKASAALKKIHLNYLNHSDLENNKGEEFKGILKNAVI